MTADSGVLVQFSFEARVIDWRGPSPFFFAPIPSPHAEDLRRVSKAVTYGWGMVPVAAQIGDVVFRTSLYPKDDGYLLPLKDVVRRKTGVTAGDVITIVLTVQPPSGSRRGQRSPV
jgi:hypothetical protein